jgi:hypothetical protein
MVKKAEHERVLGGEKIYRVHQGSNAKDSSLYLVLVYLVLNIAFTNVLYYVMRYVYCRKESRNCIFPVHSTRYFEAYPRVGSRKILIFHAVFLGYCLTFHPI